MGRRYRRRSHASQIISDSAFIGSRLPWWGALLFGVITFLLFYFIIPSWLEAKIAADTGSRIYPAIEALFGRRIHLFEWLGIVCGLIGLFFCVRNYFVMGQANSKERGIVGMLTTLLGRHID
jgi:drug/metabolite transporter (DMT)-like permease